MCRRPERRRSGASTRCYVPLLAHYRINPAAAMEGEGGLSLFYRLYKKSLTIIKIDATAAFAVALEIVSRVDNSFSK